MRTKVTLYLAFLLLITGCSTHKIFKKEKDYAFVYPKREFRGAWIQTIFQDEYQRMSIPELKESFIKKLDFLQYCGINAILFQVRPEADAFYRSEIEPWSRFYTGQQGRAPLGNFDVMAFLIEECHARKMEFHAWLNPYRASASGAQTLAFSHVYHQHPEWFVTYNKQILFDPGVPESREHICRVVEDIVKRYDVDAIHMDDYFYPYPIAGQPFPDDISFAYYGKGFSQSERDDWRRDNVNKLIDNLSKIIHKTKPWVRFGISPFGIYRNKKDTPDGTGSLTNGLQNYDDLYADVLLWDKKGWVDYLMPQLYWECRHPAADYLTLLKWWGDNIQKAHLYIGQDVARTMKAKELAEKIHAQRILPSNQGNCFWPANELLWNNNGVADSLRQLYHRAPALIPAYTNMRKKAPRAVKYLLTEWNNGEYILHWNAKQDPKKPQYAHYFVVYRFDERETIDLDNPQKIVAITQDLYIPLSYDKGERTYKYVVTPMDRYHNEGKPTKIIVKL